MKRLWFLKEQLNSSLLNFDDVFLNWSQKWTLIKWLRVVWLHPNSITCCNFHIFYKSYVIIFKILGIWSFHTYFPIRILTHAIKLLTMIKIWYSSLLFCLMMRLLLFFIFLLILLANPTSITPGKIIILWIGHIIVKCTIFLHSYRCQRDLSSYNYQNKIKINLFTMLCARHLTT